MRVTVCQLRDDAHALERGWGRLVDHVADRASDLVLLPEMPFHPWLCEAEEADAAHWEAAVAAHEAWRERLSDLAPAAVAGTRPVVRQGRRLHEAYYWDTARGYRRAHDKRFLPEEEGFWEATWYEPGDGTFDLSDVAGASVGWLMCTELWFPEYGRQQGRDGAQLLLSPRATPASTVSKWIAGGRTAAVIAGAYSLSSNRAGLSARGMGWGGAGWIIDPEGRVLGLTNDERPFLTAEVDLAVADAAKRTYPRYVR